MKNVHGKKLPVEKCAQVMGAGARVKITHGTMHAGEKLPMEKMRTGVRVMHTGARVTNYLRKNVRG